MPEKIGPHLLGRKPSPPDARDYPLRLWLGNATPLDAALASLLASRSVAKETKAWARVATPLIEASAPAPPPLPPTAVSWRNNESVLDQGDTPHCVGFGGAQWGNTLPVDDHFTNQHGEDLYYACKVIDGEPEAEDGSYVRSLAQALRDRLRLSTYAFAASTEEMLAWILMQGPVVVGTDWTQAMFKPDADGRVTPTGGIAGGHCYVALGYDPDSSLIQFLNSWGAGWGLNGRFFMRRADFNLLFMQQGEAMAAVELPL